MSQTLIDGGVVPPVTRKPVKSEREREAEEKSTVWAFVWILFGFKIATIIATFWAAAGSLEAAVILMGTNWIFIVLPMFAIWGPILFHYRMRRARRRRAMLLRSEWMLD